MVAKAAAVSLVGMAAQLVEGTGHLVVTPISGPGTFALFRLVLAVTASQRVLHDAEHPSHVTLPIIPR